MRIVNRKEFMTLPPYTLYSEYDPWILGTLCVKRENCGESDFFMSKTQDAIDCGSSEDFSEILFKAQETGCSVDMDFESIGRDGCYQYDMMYAVWENDDIEKLIDTLKKCIRE